MGLKGEVRGVLNKMSLDAVVISRWRCPISIEDNRESKRTKTVVSTVKEQIRMHSDIFRKCLVSIIMMVRGTSEKMCCLGKNYCLNYS